MKLDQELKLRALKVIFKGSSNSTIIRQVDWNRQELREKHPFVQLEQQLIERREDGHRYRFKPGVSSFTFMFHIPKFTTCSEQLIDDQQTLVEESGGLSTLQTLDADESEEEAALIIPIKTTTLANDHVRSELPSSYRFKEHRVGHSFEIDYKLLLVLDLAKGVKPHIQEYPITLHSLHNVIRDRTSTLMTPLLRFSHGLLRHDGHVFQVICSIPTVIRTEALIRLKCVFAQNVDLTHLVIKDLTVKLKSELRMRSEGLYTCQRTKINLFEKTISLDSSTPSKVNDDYPSRGEFLEIVLKVKGVPDVADFRLCNGVLSHKISVKGRLGVTKSLKQGFKLEGDVKLV